MGRYWIIFWALLITTCFIKQSEGKVVQQLEGKVIQEPEEKVVQQPERKVIQQPEGKVVQEPEGKVVQEQERKVIQPPEGKVVQEQEDKFVQQPDGKVVQPPEENIILLGDGTFQLADNLTLQGFIQECTTEADIFRCCVGFQSTVNMKACISLEYLEDEYGFELNVTVAGLVIYSEKVSAKNPPPICYHIPYTAKIADACFRIYDLDIKNKILTGCANLEIHIQFLKDLKYHLGCFDIHMKFDKKKRYELNFMKNDLI
ncbi:uncharacterized protein [Halyomorpha halys]|uniref:uncharacterized protein n=1 Tax=Halyomorpha halys TaxID=286706 RepID=UPI0006D50B35|nr:uncharacterized protein LOC106690011 [Halyomorpha halys]